MCQDASEWQMLPPIGYPTPDQLALMCATTECFNLIETLLASNLTDCLLAVGDVSLNVKKLVEELGPSCFA
ncbi:hypothetical protein Gpo141_00002866 [Globisporangium polare]